MKISKEMIQVIQNSLNNHYRRNLKADGYAGKKTAAALLSVTAIPSHWNLERQLVGYIQHICLLEDIDAGPVDGYFGPQTRNAYEELVAKLDGKPIKPWRDDEGIGATPDSNNRWPLQVQDELVKFYGPVGTNQVKIRSPYPLKLAWDVETIVTNITCHEKVARSVERVLTRVRDQYGIGGIERMRLDHWGGCLNVRKMRGGSKWSTHSWGIAMDWDPERNQLKWKDHQAQLARPEYEMWWKIWMEEGWVSLGRERNYDWMHTQAAQVKK